MIEFFDGDDDLIDMAGARFAFMFNLGEGENDAVVFKTHMTPGKYVPLHSHYDPEVLYLQSGSIEAYVDDENPGWRRIGEGQGVLLKHGIKHSLRNAYSDTAEVIVATNGRLAQFFKEAGRLVRPGTEHTRPTPEDIRKMIMVSDEFGYWMSSQEESLAITG